MILGVYGWQDSGKTSIVERLIEELSAKGYSVSTVKHAPHENDHDVEGKDTWRHSAAGGDPVALQTEEATTIMKRPGLSLDEVIGLVRREFKPDVVLVEGYKEGDLPKIAIGDIEPTGGTVMVNPTIEDAVEYVLKEVDFERAYERLPKLDCGKCGLSCSDLAREVSSGNMSLDDCPERPARRVEIIADGKRLPVGGFVAEITEKTIRGFLSSLKGYSGESDVDIRLRSSEEATEDES